jgi:hypothetical protein
VLTQPLPELQVCPAGALYDVDSIVADPETYTKEELATLYGQIVSNLERVWGRLPVGTSLGRATGKSVHSR